MDTARLKTLAGVSSPSFALSESEKMNVSSGLFFVLLDEENMHLAVKALLDAGFSLDISLSMGKYFFNFKNETVADEAFRIVSKVISSDKETKADASASQVSIA